MCKCREMCVAINRCCLYFFLWNQLNQRHRLVAAHQIVYNAANNEWLHLGNSFKSVKSLLDLRLSLLLQVTLMKSDAQHRKPFFFLNPSAGSVVLVLANSIQPYCVHSLTNNSRVRREMIDVCLVHYSIV